MIEVVFRVCRIIQEEEGDVIIQKLIKVKDFYGDDESFDYVLEQLERFNSRDEYTIVKIYKNP